MRINNEWDNEKVFIIGIMATMLFWLLVGSVCAAEHTDEEIANAIFWSEGGYSTMYPYGIRSVNCEGLQDCRRVCLNTIRNNRRRYSDYGRESYDTYLEFLASRYAPVGAGNDPTNLNRHWLKNVRWFLANPKEVRT